MELTQLFTMPKHHLTFKPLENGHYQAVDIFCGGQYNGYTWYCSEQCMHNEKCYDASSMMYRNDNGEIMND